MKTVFRITIDKIYEIMKNVNNSITQRRGERGEFMPFLSDSPPLRDANWVLGNHMITYHIYSPHEGSPAPYS